MNNKTKPVSLKSSPIPSTEQKASLITAEELESLKSQNLNLLEQNELLQLKTALRDQGEFQYQLLKVLVKATEQLNSIAQQIYDLNQVMSKYLEQNEGLDVQDTETNESEEEEEPTEE